MDNLFAEAEANGFYITLLLFERNDRHNVHKWDCHLNHQRNNYFAAKGIGSTASEALQSALDKALHPPEYDPPVKITGYLPDLGELLSKVLIKPKTTGHVRRL